LIVKRALMAGLTLAVACKSQAPVAGTPAPSAKADAASPTPRWFAEARKYETGPPMNATTPSLSLCPDGRYFTRESYEVDASFPQPQYHGRVCCRDGEKGKYELVWSASGVLQKIHLTQDNGAERDVVLEPGEKLYGSAPTKDVMFCPQ
jgi:hypothetical protein